MQHSDNKGTIQKSELSPVEKMLKVIEDLLEMRKDKNHPSVGAKISKKLSDLQSIYLAFDEPTRDEIHRLLNEKNPQLVSALAKKGSKIARPLELAEHINENLPGDIRQAMKTNPMLNMKTTAIPSHEQADDSFLESSTVRVTDASSDDTQFKDALASANRQLDPNIYALSLFKAADEDSTFSQTPLAAIIDALEILRKTQVTKDKIKKGEPKPVGFDNSYRDALRAQMNILSKHQHALAEVNLQGEQKEKLVQIIKKIVSANMNSVPDIMKSAGVISELIDLDLITRLREFESKYQPSTPRPSDYK